VAAKDMPFSRHSMMSTFVLIETHLESGSQRSMNERYPWYGGRVEVEVVGDRVVLLTLTGRRVVLAHLVRASKEKRINPRNHNFIFEMNYHACSVRCLFCDCNGSSISKSKTH